MAVRRFSETHRIRDLFPDLRTEAQKTEDKRVEQESLEAGRKEREQHSAFLSKRAGSSDATRS